MREGWEYKHLIEVCDFQGGSQPPKAEWSKDPKPNYVRMLQIRDFTQSATDYVEYVKVSKSLKYCKEDDILIGRYGASVGKILTGLAGAYNVAIIKSIPNEDIIIKKYIKSYFLSPRFQLNLGKVSLHRAAQAGFSKEDIADFVIPVPPVQEQEKIVAELDCLSGIIEKKKQQLKELDNLAQSIFYDMFGDPITNEKGWEVKRIGSFSSCIAGATPSTKYSEYWENGTIPWLSSGEVGNGRIYDTEKKITQAGYDSCSTRLIPAHTLVIAMAGQGKTRGTAGVAEIPLCTNQSICSVIPDEKVVLVDYLYYLMKMMYKDLRSISNGDGGRGGLNLKLIGSFQVIVPPLDLQNAFAQKIEAIEKQKELIKKSIQETETLFNSRMDYWFN